MKQESDCGGGERKKHFGTSPIIFLFDLDSAIRAAISFLQNTSEKHTKKQKQTNKGLQATSPRLPITLPRNGPTMTSKVWVRTNVFLRRWSRDHLSSVNALIYHFDLRARGQSFSLWLVITTVDFVIKKKFKWIEIPTHSVTLSPGTLGGWRAEQKVRNLDNFCLVGKYVRFTNITPVIYFALQTLNNKRFYFFANLIFRKGGLSLNFLTYYCYHFNVSLRCFDTVFQSL